MPVRTPAKAAEALKALRKSQESARRLGLDKLTANQIDAEIEAARREERRNQGPVQNRQ